MWETWVRSLGWEDPLNNSYPLQYSCLENSTDKGAWQALVHGVAKELLRHHLVNKTTICTTLDFLYLLICGHIGCFHVLVVENNATVNVGVCVSFQISEL